MSSDFYSYVYNTGVWSQGDGPDGYARAEGAMVWIPAGDPLGLLIYMGGVVSPFDNDTVAPQALDQIFVYDATSHAWYNQTATGVIPQNRRQFCIDVAWAPDKSSFNIYLYGGRSVPPPKVNATSFNDVYILTLPSFIWVKAWPDHHSNSTQAESGHYSLSCNMVKSMSQLFVIGGTYTDNNGCDLAVDVWAQHDLWTGTYPNAGDDDDTYWAQYYANITSNVVPIDVYDVVGGSKDGGATLTGPKAGFDLNHKPLQALMGRRPSISSRTPTRQVTAPTNSTTPTPTPTPPPPPPTSSSLSTGAIAGIVIGSVVGFAILLSAWIIIGRRIVRRRKERRESIMAQSSRLYSVASTAEAPSMTMSAEHSNYRPQSSLGPSELPSQQDDNVQGLDAVSKMPPQDIEPGQRASASAPLSRSLGSSPVHAPNLTPESHFS